MNFLYGSETSDTVFRYTITTRNFTDMKYAGFLLLLLSLTGYSQDTPSIVATWKGTSLCQIPTSPCKNENVVCHITSGSTKDSFVIQMNKIVNGKEEEMGPLNVAYVGETKSFNGKTTDRQKREDIWTFKLQDNRLEGTLMVAGKLYRIISVKKED